MPGSTPRRGSASASAHASPLNAGAREFVPVKTLNASAAPFQPMSFAPNVPLPPVQMQPVGMQPMIPFQFMASPTMRAVRSPGISPMIGTTPPVHPSPSQLNLGQPRQQLRHNIPCRSASSNGSAGRAVHPDSAAEHKPVEVQAPKVLAPSPEQAEVPEQFAADAEQPPINDDVRPSPVVETPESVVDASKLDLDAIPENQVLVVNESLPPIKEVVATEHETKKPVEKTAELVGEIPSPLSKAEAKAEALPREAVQPIVEEETAALSTEEQVIEPPGENQPMDDGVKKSDTAEPAESMLESAGEDAATEDQSSATCSYTIKFMLSLRSKFVEIPEGVDTTLNCFGRGSSQMDRRRSSAGGFRDRRSSRATSGMREFRSGSRPRHEFQPKNAESSGPDLDRSGFGSQMGKTNQRDDRRGRDGRDGRRGSYRQRSVSPEFSGPVAPLAMTENRYVIKKDIEGEKKVLRSIQSILNKLTPEKFDVLIEKLIALILESVEYLEGIVSLIFNKAVMEYNFASMYADLCTTLSTSLAAKGTASTFRSLILTTSQKEFESRVQISTFDSLPEEDREFEITKYRRRAKGFVTFVGHLFVHKLVASAIISSCVVALMGDSTCPQEDDIEHLVTLLTVTGKLFEIKRSKFVSAAFSHLMNMVNEKKLSSRLRFGIKDLVELRHRKWQPRREAVVATTIAEVHAKAAKEAAAKEAAAQDARARDRHRDFRTAGPSGRRGRDRNDRSRSRPRCMSQMLPPSHPRPARRPSMPVSNRTASDGWETTSRPSSRRGSTPLKVMPPSRDSRRSRDTETAPSAPIAKSNAFSALDEHEDEEVVEEEETTEVVGESEEKAEPVDEDALRKQVESLVREFLQIGDIKEALIRVGELSSTQLHWEIVSTTMFQSFEGKESARVLAPQLLIELASKEILSPEHFSRGLREVTLCLPDLFIDIPRLYDFMPALLTDLLVADAISMEVFNSAVVQAFAGLDSKRANALLFDTLSAASLRKDSEFVQQRLRSSKLRLTDCATGLNEDAVKELLRERELDLSTCL